MTIQQMVRKESQIVRHIRTYIYIYTNLNYI